EILDHGASGAGPHDGLGIDAPDRRAFDAPEPVPRCECLGTRHRRADLGKLVPSKRAHALSVNEAAAGAEGFRVSTHVTPASTRSAPTTKPGVNRSPKMTRE